MNKYVNSEVNQHLMKLLQLGANVQVVSGKLIFVKFKLNNDVEVAYVYNINKHNKYFLERLKPYKLPIREFDSAADVIDIIKIDVEQFKNACNSHKIRNFININKDLHHTIKSFEDLFLYYNIPTECVTQLEDSLNDIKETIKKAANESNRIFFDKDPENLN